MNTSPQHKIVLGTFASLLSLTALALTLQGHDTTPHVKREDFSAVLNVTQRAASRCGVITTAARWNAQDDTFTVNRITRPGSTDLNAHLKDTSARDAVLDLQLTCARTRSTLYFQTRVSRDLPGKALDIDVAASTGAAASLELQNETTVSQDAQAPTWLAERARLSSTVIALKNTP